MRMAIFIEDNGIKFAIDPTNIVLFEFEGVATLLTKSASSDTPKSLARLRGTFDEALDELNAALKG